MSIRLSWDLNEPVDKISIYRSRESFTEDNLPPVYKELTDGETEFIDYVVQENTVYYYMVAKHVGNGVLSNPVFTKGYFPYTGPGPTEVKRGTWYAGVFGSLTTQEFIDTEKIIRILFEKTNHPLFNEDVVYRTINNDPKWNKFVHNGKVLFVPLDGLFQITSDTSRANWKSFYECGLVYGINDVGYTPPNVTPTNQEVIIEFKNAKFRVRFIRTNATETVEPIDLFELNEEEVEVVREINDEDIKGSEYTDLLIASTYELLPEGSSGRLSNEGSLFTNTLGYKLGANLIRRNSNSTADRSCIIFYDKKAIPFYQYDVDVFSSSSFRYIPVLELVDPYEDVRVK